MTSPTAKQQPKQEMETAAVLEQAMAQLHYQNQQLLRTMWLLVTAQGGVVTVDENKIDPLWRLLPERTPEGYLRLTASVAPEVDEADIEKMAKDLVGTNGLLNTYVEAHERLCQYPLAYIEMRLSKHIQFKGDRWVTAAPETKA